MVYAIGGAFFALGGLVLTLRVLMATADACQSYEMTAIASCVIGGIAMDGGQGNILSSIIGALIMGLVMNMLQLMGISSYWQQIFTGAIIIAAVAVDSISSKK
jgi:ribose/xylose/arabinose/galactoside ABC-type transport system permease subunit